MTSSLLTPEVEARFWKKVEVTEYCWEWTANKNASGRGRFWMRSESGSKRGSDVSAPRIAMLAAGIEVPENLYVLHTCHNCSCVRPDHLYISDQSQNMRDAVERGTHNQSRKTHCPRGHAYSPENTTVNCNGGRVCRTCSRRKWAESVAAGWKRPS